MSVWEWVWECGMGITEWMKYPTWVSKLSFVFVKVIVVLFLVLFLTVAANCHLWAYFIWACFVFVSRSLSHHLHLSLTLFLWRAPAFAQKRMSQTRFKLRLRFSAYAIYHYGHSSRDIRRGKTSDCGSDVSGDCNWIAVWLWMPPQCRCRCRGNLSNSKKTQRKWKKKNKTKLKKRPRNKSENLFCIVLMCVQRVNSLLLLLLLLFTVVLLSCIWLWLFNRLSSSHTVVQGVNSSECTKYKYNTHTHTYKTHTQTCAWITAALFMLLISVYDQKRAPNTTVQRGEQLAEQPPELAAWWRFRFSCLCNPARNSSWESARGLQWEKDGQSGQQQEREEQMGLQW